MERSVPRWLDLKYPKFNCCSSASTCWCWYVIIPLGLIFSRGRQEYAVLTGLTAMTLKGTKPCALVQHVLPKGKILIDRMYVDVFRKTIHCRQWSKRHALAPTLGMVTTFSEGRLSTKPYITDLKDA